MNLNLVLYRLIVFANVYANPFNIICNLHPIFNNQNYSAKFIVKECITISFDNYLILIFNFRKDTKSEFISKW